MQPELDLSPTDCQSLAVTEPQILARLLKSQYQGNSGTTCMPHYTPDGWWECDLAVFSRAGYLTEYEIKLTLQDFRADRKKHQLYHRRAGMRVPNRAGGPAADQLYDRLYKHAQIEQGAGPKYFWFCTPRRLVPDREIPSWAGLMEFEWVRPHHRPDRLVLKSRVVRHAPHIRGCRKYGQEVLDHCRSVAYYRYLNQLVAS